jgi:hypothetical protein
LEYTNVAQLHPKTVLNSMGDWPFGKGAELAKKISERCVDECLRVDWRQRPSASILLEFVRGFLVEANQMNLGHVYNMRKEW